MAKIIYIHFPLNHDRNSEYPFSKSRWSESIYIYFLTVAKQKMKKNNKTTYLSVHIKSYFIEIVRFINQSGFLHLKFASTSILNRTHLVSMTTVKFTKARDKKRAGKENWLTVCVILPPYIPFLDSISETGGKKHGFVPTCFNSYSSEHSFIFFSSKKRRVPFCSCCCFFTYEFDGFIFVIRWIPMGNHMLWQGCTLFKYFWCSIIWKTVLCFFSFLENL